MLSRMYIQSMPERDMYMQVFTVTDDPGNLHGISAGMLEFEMMIYGGLRTFQED